ncbi:hypothetical protein BZG36_04916 [Bifiguratus adelaidae]|uniref:Bulb-type lectin domain-containing protein n=1 Tax=Bifiguratus adelaidae TaxID=1938954 RepID=A0A261XV87_9FUNG|nr:hypothetical protein BZG36_04916 [Bifiguratus adelaidae]
MFTGLFTSALWIAGVCGLSATAAASCISSGDQNTINSAFKAGGVGAVVQLCPSAVITITDYIQFTADHQELSTQGYPTGSTRATIQLNSQGTNASTLISGAWISGLRILNIQVDGNRAGNGFLSNGGANIEVGGGGTGLIVSHVASRNPRGWSCLHVIEGGTMSSLCLNATVTNNDIGPCGQEGTNSAGQGMWADGISFACASSLVSGNSITGSTDGGIVIFGAPGTQVTNNTITSSTTNKGFGAINLVDNTYNGNYSGVVVSDNTIVGEKLFSVGIAIGSNVWGGYGNTPHQGPTTITGNTFSGNITFPIAINGWENGLTVTNNDDSGVHTPNSAFADDVQCPHATQLLFNANAHFSYWPTGLVSPYTLQSGFVQATEEPYSFICTTGPLPSNITYGLNQLFMGPGNVALLHENIMIAYQGDSNLVVYNTSSSGNAIVEWASGHTLTNGTCGNLCDIAFQGDGNLVTYYNGQPQWSTNTQNKGNTMVLMNKSPWIEILDASGNVVWSAIPIPTTTSSTKTATTTSSSTTTSSTKITTTTTSTSSPTSTTPTCSSANQGNYYCINSGVSPAYEICDNGSFVSGNCGAGTVCKTSGNSIVCDYP